MRNIKLNDSECMFIYYHFIAYASQATNLDKEEKEDMYELAAKFK
jgi:hypothetical protein